MKPRLCLQLLLDLPLELVHVIDARGQRSTEHVHLLVEPQSKAQVASRQDFPPEGSKMYHQISSVTAIQLGNLRPKVLSPLQNWHQMDHQKTARIDAFEMIKKLRIEKASAFGKPCILLNKMNIGHTQCFLPKTILHDFS